MRGRASAIVGVRACTPSRRRECTFEGARFAGRLRVHRRQVEERRAVWLLRRQVKKRSAVFMQRRPPYGVAATGARFGIMEDVERVVTDKCRRGYHEYAI